MEEEQTILTFLDFLKFSKICSPQPMAAGTCNSEHLIAICEFTPPYLVINPIKLVVNSQS